MELHAQIKRYRTQANLSQEELAEQVYVTRQTVSNWETGKSYPDIHSLLLLSNLFGVSLDTLIKGDIETMKEAEEREVRKFNRWGVIYTVLLLATILSVIPLLLWSGLWLRVAAGTLYVVCILTSIYVERLKKQNDVFTYKEIVAFSEGKRLDEISRLKEEGKRPYQQGIAAVGCALAGILIAVSVKLLV